MFSKTMCRATFFKKEKEKWVESNEMRTELRLNNEMEEINAPGKAGIWAGAIKWLLWMIAGYI